MVTTSNGLRRRWRRVTGRAAVSLAMAAAVVLSAADKDRRSWRDYGGSPDNARFIPLKQLNKSNVGKLEVAWSYPFGETGFNPIVVRGVVYGLARNSSLVALDAATGKELWIREGLQGITSRGMNYWESKDGKDRRLIFSISDYLQELDAETGEPILTFGTNGAVDLREGLSRDPATIGHIQSGTPGKVFENLLILGSATGEDYFSPPGDLRAYDVVTGKMAWIFHTVPHPGEFGYETWPRDAWKYIGGTNTWGELTVDAERGIAYFPISSPTFDFYGGDRHGENLFSDSLVALDARTGKRLWHFQNVHHDLWDYDNVSAPQLTTIRQNGRTIDVVAMAGKTGFLYVFNRVTGEPIWPIEERPVPTKTEVPGEQVWPTQPFPTNPPPFARQSFTPDDVGPHLLSPTRYEEFKQRVAKARNEGMFTPIGFGEAIHMPGNHGGSNWGSTAAHPNDGTVYVISYNLPAIMRLVTPEEAATRAREARSGAALGPASAVYQRECQACHGADRAGGPNGPSLIGVASRMPANDVRAAITNGRGRMAALPHLTSIDLDAAVGYLFAVDAAGGPGSVGAPPTFPPGPVVGSGAVMLRPARAAGAPSRPTAYPEGAEAPAYRYYMYSYGLYAYIITPPYQTLTAYDLNKGTIKWQVPVGGDLRLLPQGIKGTGTAATNKMGMVHTATGLVFATAGDRNVHAYDADTGKELWTGPFGGPTRGLPSMYEHKGRQYLLVTAGVGAGENPLLAGIASPPHLPKGYIAWALPGKYPKGER